MPTEGNTKHATLACLLEAVARKPGNVHPEAAFADLAFGDFARSAFLIGPSFAEASEGGVGRLVLDAVGRTQRVVGRNTNLGIVLLLAPMACVPVGTALEEGIPRVLAGLTRDDAASVYEAIRLAKPGGLGRVEREDVDSVPGVTLLEAMRLAADRDQIAAQYANNFSTVLAAARRLSRGSRFPDRWEEAVIDLALWLMAEFPDTLIARKCGAETARDSSRRARAVFDAGWPDGEASRTLFAQLDRWLRADGNRRNPGTTADLVAASLFAGFRDGLFPAPPIPACARSFLPNGTDA